MGGLVGPEHRVDLRLVALAQGLEPVQDVRVDADGGGLFLHPEDELGERRKEIGGHDRARMPHPGPMLGIAAAHPPKLGVPGRAHHLPGTTSLPCPRVRIRPGRKARSFF